LLGLFLFFFFLFSFLSKKNIILGFNEQLTQLLQLLPFYGSLEENGSRSDMLSSHKGKKMNGDHGSILSAKSLSHRSGWRRLHKATATTDPRRARCL
jgi:hypothetical protein